MTKKQFKQLKDKYGNSSSFIFSHWIDKTMPYDLAEDIAKSLIKEDNDRVKPEYY